MPVDLRPLNHPDVRSKLPLGANGLPVSCSRLRAWIANGIQLRDRSRLKLAAVLCGGQWTVDPNAVTEFLTALTADRSKGA